MSLNLSDSHIEENMLTSRLYTLLVGVEFFIYILTTVISPYFFVRLRKISLLHANLRVILCNIPILFALMMLHRFHFLVEYIIIYVVKQKDLVVLSFHRCIGVRFFYDLGICVLAFAIPSFTFERFLATWKPQKYERTATPKMGFIWTVFSYIGACGYAATFLYMDWTHKESWHDSFGRLCCDMMFTQPQVFMCLALSCFVFYFSCIPILVVLYKFNVNKMRQNGAQQLNVRYQYGENVAAIRSIVPSVVGYGCVLTVNVVSIVCQYVQTHSSATSVEGLQKIWFMEQVVNVFIALYTLSYLSMFFVTYAPLNKAFWRDFDWLRVHRRTRISDSGGNAIAENHKTTTESYFAQFNSQWK